MLQIENLVAGYGRLAVLHEVSISVPQGSLTGVVGPNGAGKTTLMNSIFNITDIMFGEVRFNGEVISGHSPDRIASLGIGYVPQRNNVFPRLTVHENLEIAADSLSPKSRRGREAIERCYALFPRLNERRQQKASSLSGGERQMLAIASATLLEPALLLLDEPTAGLAPQLVQEVTESVVRMREEGTTLVWVVEENPLQVLTVVDSVYVLEGGVVKGHQTGKELIDNPNFITMFMGASAA